MVSKREIKRFIAVITSVIVLIALFMFDRIGQSYWDRVNSSNAKMIANAVEKYKAGNNWILFDGKEWRVVEGSDRWRIKETVDIIME